MTSLLLPLSAVERLAMRPGSLPVEFATALRDDLEYARFGAALPQLPVFGSARAGLWAHRNPEAHWLCQGLSFGAPVGFGFKAAELVSLGALVGKEPGHAFLAGYFVQWCVERRLGGVASRMAVSAGAPGDEPLQAERRIRTAWALFYAHEVHGSMLLGTPLIRSKLAIRKASGSKGISRGLYELVRVAAYETFGQSPLKFEVDGWVRGLYGRAWLWSSPLGHAGEPGAALKSFYRGPEVDVWTAVDQALEDARALLGYLAALIRRGGFGARNRAKFLSRWPEGMSELPAQPARPEDAEVDPVEEEEVSLTG